MWGINEMNQLADIARLLQTAEEEKPHLCKYYEGIKGGFTRQRSSKVGEVLDSIVRPLVADDALKKHPELVSLIDNDQILSRLREKLRRLFYGVFKDEFERHRQIRHRITEHFDHKTAFAVLPEALRLTVEQQRQRDFEPPHGWLMYGISDDTKHEARFALVDEVLTTAWREVILQVPFSQEGYAKCPRIRRVRRFTHYFMGLFHRFAGRLIEQYCLHYKLAIERDPNELMVPPELRTYKAAEEDQSI